MRFVRLFALLSLALTFLFSAATPTFAATTLTVDDNFGGTGACPGAKFKTIQAAIKAAAAGDQIVVCAGNYKGSILIDKSVKLIANPKLGAKVSGNNLNNIVFHLTAPNVVVDGFEISSALKTGIQVDATATNARVSGNNVHDNVNFGIDIQGKGATVSGNTVTKNGTAGNAGTAGIRINGTTGVRVQSNTTNTNNASGIQLFNADFNQLNGNTSNQNGIDGFEICNRSDGNTLDFNVAQANKSDGIFVDSQTGDFCSQGNPSGVNNTISRTAMHNNGAFDARDVSVGTRTAGTANTWTANSCEKQNRTGLCL